MASADSSPNPYREYSSVKTEQIGLIYTTPVDYKEASEQEQNAKDELDYWSRTRVVISATIVKEYIAIPGGEGKWMVELKGFCAKSPGKDWHFAGKQNNMAIFYKEVGVNDVEDKDVEAKEKSEDK